MGLKRDYANKKAETTRDRGTKVVTGCRSRTEFLAIKPEVDELEVRVTTLAGVIVARNMRNNTVNTAIKNAKDAVVEQMDVVRKKADDICNGNESLELSSGFTPTKTTRTPRKDIDPVVLVSASPNGSLGYLLLKIMQTIPGNIGYEVHCVTGGKDTIVCVVKVKGRTKTMLAFNFPSGVKVEVYVVTLATNEVTSIPSNRVFGTAA